MTLSEQVRPYLEAALRGDTLTAAQAELGALRGSERYAALPHTLSSKKSAQTSPQMQNQFVLRTTIDMLAALAAGDERAALEAAAGLHLEAAVCLLEGQPYLLAAQLATRLESAGVGTGSGSAAAFGQLYQDYLDHSVMLSALEALSGMLASPYLTELDEVGQDNAVQNGVRQDGAGQDDVRQDAKPGADSGSAAFYLPLPLPEAVFSPLSNAPQDDALRTYIVQVRQLTDAATADFAVFSAVLADLTDGGVFGRENRGGERYADLLLEFGREAAYLLGSLDPVTLSMRFVFRGSSEFEMFSAQSGTLYGLEVSLDEYRLYFKLKIPAAWAAAEVPLHLIWANLESCVLLSHPV